jgi:hypothetical protein
MKTHCSKLSPEELDTQERQTEAIVSLWSELRVGGNSGATTWEVLDQLEQQVSECLSRKPPDLVEARSLTYKAALLMAGSYDL